MNRMAALLSDQHLQCTSSEFIEIRDLANCRLTLFSARRGCEPARLTAENWLDARNNDWLNQDRLVKMDKVDRNVFTQMKVIYQSGKGNHLVPVLVPTDTVKPKWTVMYFPVNDTYFQALRCQQSIFIDGTLFTNLDVGHQTSFHQTFGHRQPRH